MEIWKEIPRTNKKYSVSNYGRVKSNERIIIRNNGRNQKINEKILTPILSSTGYYKVRLNIQQGVQKNLKIHSLLAEAFWGYTFKDYGLVINHKDGNKLNNHIENLEIVSQKQNILHSWEKGLSLNDHFKISVIVDGIFFNSITEAAKFLKVDRNTISKCLKKGYYQPQNYQVVYNGKKYLSLKEASRKVGLNPKTIQKYGSVIKPKKIKIELA